MPKSDNSGILGKITPYDIVGVAALMIAFMMPDTLYINFINSIFQAFSSLGQIPAPVVSNQQFTVLEMRAVLIVFGVLFLVPRLLSAIMKPSPKGGRRK